MAALLGEALGETSQIVFFLIGAMGIVETVDAYNVIQNIALTVLYNLTLTVVYNLALTVF